MFAYCLNKPLGFVDNQGSFATRIDLTDQDEDGDGLPDEPGAAASGRASSSGAGFSTFSKLKNFLGSAGENMHWHHIVEKCQIEKSGFAPEQVHNTSNVIAVDAQAHAKITGYYNTTTYDFTGGVSVRNWLAGQPFEGQLDFGTQILRSFGVNK